MAIKKAKYKVYLPLKDEPEILTYEDIKDKNPSGFPTTYFAEVLMDEGIEAFVVFEMCGLCNTRGEARRLLKQGGGYKHIPGTRKPVEFQTIQAHSDLIVLEDFEDGRLYLRAGKKKLHRLEIL
jgi:tyrosyl-tRNA synthetase